MRINRKHGIKDKLAIYRAISKIIKINAQISHNRVKRIIFKKNQIFMKYPRI